MRALRLRNFSRYLLAYLDNFFFFKYKMFKCTFFYKKNNRKNVRNKNYNKYTHGVSVRILVLYNLHRDVGILYSMIILKYITYTLYIGCYRYLLYPIRVVFQNSIKEFARKMYAID